FRSSSRQTITARRAPAARQIAARWSERVARPRHCVTTCCSGARSAPSATATGPRSTTADDQTLPEHATCVPPGPATAQIVIGHALVVAGHDVVVTERG